MKKFTLLILALLMILGGVKAQSYGLANEGVFSTDGNGTLGNNWYNVCPSYVAWSFNEEVTFDQIKIAFRDLVANKFTISYGESADAELTNIEVEVTEPESGWEALKNSAENVSNWVTKKLDTPVNAKYIKVTINSNFGENQVATIEALKIQNTTATPKFTYATINAKANNVKVGSSLELTAETFDQNGEPIETSVTYKTTPENVGTFEGNKFIPTVAGEVTISASNAKSNEVKIVVKEPIVHPTIHAVQQLTTIDATYYDNDIKSIRGVLNNNNNNFPQYNDTGLLYNVEEVSLGDNDNALMFSGKDDAKLGDNVFGIACSGFRAYESNVKTGADYTVSIAVFPVNADKIYYSKDVWTEERNFIELSVTPNQWNYITYQPLKDNLTDHEFTGMAFKCPEGSIVYLDNFQMQKEFVPDDGEAPKISSTLVKGISVGSATFEIVANDNSDELKYKVVAVDKDNNTYSAEVKGGKGYPVTLRIEGLVHNTTYTATVTVSDGFNSVKEEGITFKTKELPHAVKLSPAATKYYYDNHADALDAHIRGYVTSGYDNVGSFYDHAGFDVKEITIGNVIENDKEIPDNVLKFTGKNGGTFTDAFGIGILGTDEFGINDGKDYLVRFAIYPVDIDEIEYAGKIYKEEDVFKTRKVIPNQWNYISFKPLENYEGNNNFTGILIRCKEGKTVYLDNFCYYTSSDKTPPVITEYKIGKTFATSASMSIKGYDKNGETQSLTGMLKYEIWVEDANGKRQAALVRGENNVENPVEVAAYVRGIAPGEDNKAKIWVIARDAAENQAETEKVEVTFATVLDKNINVESFEEKENIEDAYNVTDKSVVLTDKSHGGLIILNGQWDATEFNKIAAKYPYSCFDMRNVKFTDDNRIDHGDGTNGTITVFNPNTYFITDVTNKFDGNYATYEADGSLMAMNMHWFDGEWKWDGDDVPDGRVDYKKIVNDNTNEGETYLGISSFGYIKLDPYTGFDLVVREQGCGITRDVKVPEGENKYSTVICPFSLNTSSDYVAGSRFYELETPSVITDGDNNTTVTLNFTEITGKTKPNTPYLVLLAQNTKSLYFVDEDKDIKKTIVFPENVEEMKGDIATGGNVSAYMFGTYITRTLSGPTDVYGLKQGNQTLTLVTPKEGKKIEIPAFRAAMKLTQIPSNAKSILISFDGETTGITSIDNDVINAVLGNIYSIDGKKVGNTSNGMINLPAGIYIVNGKKVVVK